MGPLQNTDMLSNHTCGDSASTLELSLVVSLNQVYECILLGRARDKVDAICALIDVSPREDIVALTTLGSCLADTSASVRTAAVEGVAKLANAEDKLLVSQMKLRLRDQDEMVRQAAAKALVELESI